MIIDWRVIVMVLGKLKFGEINYLKKWNFEFFSISWVINKLNRWWKKLKSWEINYMNKWNFKFFLSVR